MLSNLKFSTKAMLAFLASVVALYQAPEIQAIVHPILLAHPHIASLVIGAIAVYNVLTHPKE